MVGRYGGVGLVQPRRPRPGHPPLPDHRLAEGATLSEVTGEITRAWDLGLTLLPVTDDALRTRVTVVDPDAEREVGFQEWFVQRRHEVPVTAIRMVGAAEPAPPPV